MQSRIIPFVPLDAQQAQRDAGQEQNKRAELKAESIEIIVDLLNKLKTDDDTLSSLFAFFHTVIICSTETERARKIILRNQRTANERRPNGCSR